MPTSSDFYASAVGLDQASEDIEALVGLCQSSLGPQTISGGALGELVEVTMEVSDQHLRTAASTLADLAQTCRARAAACTAYAGQVGLYRQELSTWEHSVESLPPGEATPTRPRPPARPPAWVSI